MGGPDIQAEIDEIKDQVRQVLSSAKIDVAALEFQVLMIDRVRFHTTTYRNPGDKESTRYFRMEFTGRPDQGSNPNLQNGGLIVRPGQKVRMPILSPTGNAIYMDADEVLLPALLEQVKMQRLYMIFAQATSRQSYAELAGRN